MTTFERSAAFWLRAYPPAWRAERAAEVTAVLRDLAGADARRLDARTALGLLRAGLATRWRQTPPMRVYLPYRLFDARVPARYREWVRQDISSPGYQRRSFLGRMWTFFLPLYQALTTDLGAVILVAWSAIGIAGVATVLCVRPDGAIRRRLQHHTRLGPGEPPDVGAFVWVRSSRARIAGYPGARFAVLLLAVGAAAWSTAALVAPRRLLLETVPCEPSARACVELGSTVTGRDISPVVAAFLVGVALVGVVLAVLVARRLDRRLPARPEQAARHLLAPRPQARVGIALWIGLIITAALAEATGVWVFAVSAVAAPVCLLLLPPAILLQRRARATPDAALIDLWRVALTGRPIAIDRHDAELVPASVLDVG